MSSIPENIWKKLIQEEGSEYTNDPIDRGGETKFGISKKANPDIDVKNLTEEKAKKIYEERYWNKLPEDKKDWQHFSTMVHTGKPLSKEEQIQKYIDIVKKRPEQRKYLNGWMNRAMGGNEFGKGKKDLRQIDVEELQEMLAPVEKEVEQSREPAGSFNPSEVSFSLMPDESPKDPRKVSDAEFDLAVEDAGFGEKPEVAEEPKVAEEPEVNIPETFEPMDLTSNVNMSKAPVEDVPEFAKEEPVQSEENEFLPSVKVDTPEQEDPMDDEIRKDMAMEDLEVQQAKEAEDKEDEDALAEDDLNSEVEEIKDEKIEEVTGGRFEKGQPHIDKVLESQLVPKEVWADKGKSLDDIAEVMNTNVQDRYNKIEAQFKEDKDSSQKDQLLITILLAAQAFANGMAARGTGQPARPVNLGLLKRMEDSLTDTRDYRMKRAKLTLDQAKFRFNVRKDARDLGLRQEKDVTKQKEKSRLEGKKDAEKLDKQQTSLAKDEFKRESKSVDSVLKDVKGQKRDNKVRQTAVDSIIANMGKTREEAEEMVQDRNFLGKLTDSDLFGLGLSDLDRTELLEKLSKEKPSTDSIKPTTKRSDSLYDPKIHYLGKAADGKTYIYRKDNDQGVAEYGKQ